jgi:hypothetical protein
MNSAAIAIVVALALGFAAVAVLGAETNVTNGATFASMSDYVTEVGEALGADKCGVWPLSKLATPQTNACVHRAIADAVTGVHRATLDNVYDNTVDMHNRLNERGDLIGVAVDSRYTAHGFLHTHDGNFVSFDAPGNAVGNYNGTSPSSINSSGTIAGTYFHNNGTGHGFVRYPDGSIVSFDAPGVARHQAAWDS